MICLENPILRVSILHPDDDRRLLGPRYCTGGYIYQIEHARHGPLLSGPEFPSPSPDVINGQGAPDVFQNTLFEKSDEIPSHKLIIGVGLVENSMRLKQADSHFQAKVETACKWNIRHDSSSFTAATSQEYGEYMLSLTRSVQLREHEVLSSTFIQNRSALRPLPVRMFAHPFFPLPASARFHSPVRIPPHPGFHNDENGSVRMRDDVEWNTGHFLDAEGFEGHPLSATITHPSAGEMRVTTDFPLFRLAFWANDRTFSVEPFHSLVLPPGGSAQWQIVYSVPA